MIHATPFRLLCALAAVAGLVRPAGTAGAQTGYADRLLKVDQDAYVVMPAEAVCGPGATQCTWSPAGEYLLAARVRPRVLRSEVPALFAQGLSPSRTDTALVLWSQATGQSTTVWRTGEARALPAEAHWLTGAPIALVVIHRQAPGTGASGTPGPEVVLLRVDARTSETSRVADVPGAQPSAVFPSPRAPVVGVVYVVERVPDGNGPAVPQTFVALLNAAGRAVCRAQVPAGERPLVVQWTADGRPVVRTSRTVDGKRTVRSLLVDQRTGATSLLPADTPMHSGPEAASMFEVKTASAALDSGRSPRAIRPVWLTARNRPDAGAVLLAADGGAPLLAPRGNAVAYQSGGVLCVSEIVRIPREAAEAGLERARRAELLSRGKQVALATLMYAMDHSEELPASESFSPALLEPYLKDAALMQGFNYTFAGGKLGSVQEPATTELGHIAGPNGRAVVYVDGHVVWQPDGGQAP